MRVDEANRIDRCHPQDPSWVLWPAFEHAVLENIVPDFPLINKSFNRSYSGHDLQPRNALEGETYRILRDALRVGIVTEEPPGWDPTLRIRAQRLEKTARKRF